MNRNWAVVEVVWVGALLHASWNALVKPSSDKTRDTELIHVMGSALACVASAWEQGGV